MPQLTQTLDSKENLAELLVIPKPSPGKKVTIEMSKKNTSEYNTKDPFRTYLDSVFPLTCELLNIIN